MLTRDNPTTEDAVSIFHFCQSLDHDVGNGGKKKKVGC